MKCFKNQTVAKCTANLLWWPMRPILYKLVSCKKDNESWVSNVRSLSELATSTPKPNS